MPESNCNWLIIDESLWLKPCGRCWFWELEVVDGVHLVCDMNGLRFTGHDDGQLRELLSLKIIRHMNLTNTGSDGLDALSVRVSRFARQFEHLRLVGSEQLSMNSPSQSDGCQNTTMAYTRSRVPTTHQL